MTILTDDTGQVMYVVRVRGANVTAPTSSKVVAEQQKSQLPPETQAIAEVVSITADGKEILFG